MLCSVVKHFGGGRTRKKYRVKHETQLSVFPYFLSALPFPKCFTTKQNAVEGSLFVLSQRIHYFPIALAEFLNQTLFSKGVKVVSAVCCSLIKHAKISQLHSLLKLLK